MTATIIDSQEEILAQAVVLAAFIPMLIDTGGNVGAQSSTVVIRGLNTDELKDLGIGEVIFREGLAGLLLGLLLGIVALTWAFWLQGNLDVALVVGFSLVAISFLASVAGSGLPFLFKSFGFDPALISAPFITTAVDVLGVLIYFYVARTILGL